MVGTPRNFYPAVMPLKIGGAKKGIHTQQKSDLGFMAGQDVLFALEEEHGKDSTT